MYQINDEIVLPRKGEGLNKEAIFTLYNIKPVHSNENNDAELQKVLKKECKRKNMTFVDYDRYAGEWTFKVDNL